MLNDISKILELTNASKASQSLDENEKGITISYSQTSSEGRYYLNDCHNASGMGDNKAPNR